jgi:hypothetical protein
MRESASAPEAEDLTLAVAVMVSSVTVACSARSFSGLSR